MGECELKRVRDDLATMKQAVRVELPFGREDVRLSLGWGGRRGAGGRLCGP